MLKERIEEVTQTNEAFYKAFESLDVAAMESSLGPSRVCDVHSPRLEYSSRMAGGPRFLGSHF